MKKGGHGQMMLIGVHSTMVHAPQFMSCNMYVTICIYTFVYRTISLWWLHMQHPLKRLQRSSMML